MKSSGSPPKQAQEAATTGIPLSSSNQYSTESCETNTRLQTKTRVPWSSGLCDCFSDWRNCCITCWCPCVTFGQIAEIVDKGSSSCGLNGALYTLIACVTGCACCYSCFYRCKMRQQYMLKKHPCGDCLVHCCCEYCALCQEYRELKTHGYDLSIGNSFNIIHA
ncbi:protein PLANT CADMIUM RESISTANCE 2-like [Gossypium australe]|uniref:Protein PLANT CADMIUM RESISTANCE 2-like n=1 Tax=Gossypium australe TaxID=47621 RepID=A0A5B6VA20_9ROSI|nr:protein PLANT CADMIUM RESISTANCE 2-like [Gossypium australe]